MSPTPSQIHDCFFNYCYICLVSAYICNMYTHIHTQHLLRAQPTEASQCCSYVHRLGSPRLANCQGAISSWRKLTFLLAAATDALLPPHCHGNCCYAGLVEAAIVLKLHGCSCPAMSRRHYLAVGTLVLWFLESFFPLFHDSS